MVEPHSSNFRVITTNFLSVRIFRKFSVCYAFSVSVVREVSLNKDSWKKLVPLILLKM